MHETVDLQLWWRCFGRDHRLVERIAGRALAVAPANALQERVCSFCKHIDHATRQSLEMLLLCSFNKKFFESAEGGGLFSAEDLVKALEASTSSIRAVKELINFLDLDGLVELDDDDDETDVGLKIATMLKMTATEIDGNRAGGAEEIAAVSRKRPRPEAEVAVIVLD